MTGPTRIAVIGGGVGALTAAFALSERPDAGQRFEITVYQPGWRLGGKGASGRHFPPQDTAGANASRRIEEHGLHVWAGFYDNAFRVMRDVYGLCDRHAPGQTYRSFDDAFLPHDVFHLAYRYEGDWIFDALQPPRNAATPGRETALLGPLDYLRMAGDGLDRLLAEDGEPGARARSLIGAATFAAFRHAARRVAWIARGLSPGDAPGPLADAVDHLAGLVHRRLLAAASDSAEQERLLVTLDLLAAAIAGMIGDRLVERGFEAVDDEDFAAWLRRHGALERTLQAAPIRACYDYVFGFKHGAAAAGQRAVAAGTGLHGLLRLMLTYKGAVFWKMRGSMGDTIFAPLYLALRARGVRFEFFHRARELHIDRLGGQPRIERIDMHRQADLAGGRTAYDPLIHVPTELPSGPVDLACWPNRPLYDQLALPPGCTGWAEVDFESPWDTTHSKALTLTRGRDFDAVVLGVPVAALGDMTQELAAASPRWRAMLEQVSTVATRSMQLWFDRTVDDLGWPHGSTILTGFAPPFDTWADMSHLLTAEAWPTGHEPRSLGYFCAPLSDPPGPGRDPAHHQDDQTARVRDEAAEWIDTYLPVLFPQAATTRDGRTGFDWSVLHDPEGRMGRERLRAQYFRANVAGSDRYVLSLPGSTRYRLPAERSGFDGLYLAGDWVATAINAGCVEAASMAGLAAARGVSGDPIEIRGDRPSPTGRRSPARRPGPRQALRAHMERWPWSLASARLTTSAVAAATHADTRQVSGLLPAPLVTLTQPGDARRGQHPLIFLFAHHAGVRPVLAPAGLSYRECVLTVPDVGLAEPDGPTIGPFVYVVRLWLDRFIPVVAGLAAYGYPKVPAWIEADHGRYAVRDWRYRTPLLEAQFAAPEVPDATGRFALPGALAEMFDQPLLSWHPVGGWITSFFDFRLAETVVGPVHAEITLGDAFRPALPPGTRDVPAAPGAAGPWTASEPDVAGQPERTRPSGAFRLEGPTRLTNPLQSRSLERLVARFYGS